MDHLSHEPLWRKTNVQPSFPNLSSDLTVDVVVIGGGITGLTAALLLKRAGKNVIVVEQRQIASIDSGHTTAHLTQILDSRYSQIVHDFGKEAARRVAESKEAAIDQIERTAREESIDCDFQRVPGFLFTEEKKDTRMLERELEATRSLGIKAEAVDGFSFLGLRSSSAIRFENQARFHPVKYLSGLAKKMEGLVYEKTHVISIEDGNPCTVLTNHGKITAKDVIVATHTPISNRFLLHTKIAAYRTYAIAVKMRADNAFDGLLWDTADPYHYIRRQDDLWIIGGEDHKTGHIESTEECYQRLEKWARARFEIDSVLHRWSGQFYEPVDGLPYIGKNPASEHLYVATGFSGNGMTFGTLSGMILSDAVLGAKNPWAKIYRPSRIKPLASAMDFISENVDFPLCLLKDRISGPYAKELSQIAEGEGKLMKLDGKSVAVYRDEGGQIKACSATCPHMGCLVHFNNSERSWDCPCHGSRFDTDGRVMNGPALGGLEPTAIPEIQKTKKAA